jgi:DNA-binding transcriptional LysR family regulator
LRNVISNLAERQGIDVEVAMETDSLESINRLVQHGLGLSFVPRSSVQDDILSGKLVVIPLTDANLGSRTVTLIRRADSVLPACADQFLRALPKLLGNPEAEA